MKPLIKSEATIIVNYPWPSSPQEENINKNSVRVQV